MRTPWVSFDGKDCYGCKHLNDRGYCEFTACIIPCTVIATIPEVKPQTNADRIRSMTDEELAKWIFTSIAWQIQNFRHGEQVKDDEAWLEWLRGGASDGTTDNNY